MTILWPHIISVLFSRICIVLGENGHLISLAFQNVERKKIHHCLLTWCVFTPLEYFSYLVIRLCPAVSTHLGHSPFILRIIPTGIFILPFWLPTSGEQRLLPMVQPVGSQRILSPSPHLWPQNLHLSESPKIFSKEGSSYLMWFQWTPPQAEGSLRSCPWCHESLLPPPNL